MTIVKTDHEPNPHTKTDVIDLMRQCAHVCYVKPDDVVVVSVNGVEIIYIRLIERLHMENSLAELIIGTTSVRFRQNKTASDAVKELEDVARRKAKI